ncbi:centromere protein K [Cuculus canorus]|uniref:centromere protein K n=1 Tax=Cuculus canorus TaxID=55661 RepID=UPI0023AA276A|nr:centromere protein K [Cuculus canorus]
MAACLPDAVSLTRFPRGNESQEEDVGEYKTVWKQVEESQRKLMLLEKDTLLKSDTKHSLLMIRNKALMDEYDEWQRRSPEVLPAEPDVLIALGKEELQKVKDDLDMALAMVQLKNKQLEEDLEREQQWHEDQEKTLGILNKIEEETKIQDEQASKKGLSDTIFHDLQKKMLRLKRYNEEIWTALGKFLQEQFPLPEKGESSKRKKKPSEKPDVKLITLKEILELLINKLMETPHEPYIRVNDSFWPPYVELLLRCGVALRHPGDPNRLRLESFHM